MARGRAMKARGRSALAKLSVPLNWRYGRDLTEAARRGQLGPVIGRDEELARLIQVLGRKTKNNPVLIGKSGVGKTAIVEGLAQQIAEGMVPPGLQGKRLVSLDLATMLAGARIRGEFEERLKSALALLAASKGEFVLLIDELHMIVGTGGGDGGMDVSNMLKPMLARGDLRLIGASTPDEYRKHVERDAALERLFQPVHVEAPSLRDTVEILRGLRERHEVYHGVRISDSAIEAAVALSDRYVSGRQLPDKGVDLIDEAASRLRIGIECPPPGLDRVTRAARRVEMELIALDRNGGPAAQRDQLGQELVVLQARAKAMTTQWRAEQDAIFSIRRINQELAQKRAEAARCERAGDLTRAADIAYGQIGELDRRLEAAVKTLADLQAGGGMLRSEVDTEEVAAVVSAWTGVPVSRLIQVLDDGRLTDGHGRTVDFTNTVLIMTSNLREDPKDFFRPEFINRIDEIVRFRSLTPADLSEIVRIQLRQLAGRAEGVGITLEVDNAAEAWLAARGYDPDYGARPLRRVIQRELGDRLAVLLLDGTFNAGDTIHIGVADDQPSFH